MDVFFMRLSRHVACLSVFLLSVPTILNAADSGDIAPSVAIPLHYYPEYGVYTADLKIGKEPAQTVEAIIDTGSAVMVIVADKVYCPSCSTAFTKGALDPLKAGLSLHNNKTVELDYGSATDTVTEYVGPVRYAANALNQLFMKVFVLKNSSQPASIVGMIEHNIKGDPINTTPFIVELTKDFNRYSEITFVLCADKGKSYYQLGPVKLPPPLVESKLSTSQFYEIATSGFYDENNKPIAKTLKNYGGAILDTGTGGFIVLTPRLYKPLYRYIYQHAGKVNQALPKRFWQENYCVPRKEVDFTSLPPIKIGIKSMKDNAPYHLTLLPTSYINRAGCDEGQVRFVFNSSLPPNFYTAIRNHNARIMNGAHPEMVIGTALFNQYAMTIFFKPKDKHHIALYENDRLCHINAQKEKQ